MATLPKQLKAMEDSIDELLAQHTQPQPQSTPNQESNTTQTTAPQGEDGVPATPQDSTPQNVQAVTPQQPNINELLLSQISDFKNEMRAELEEIKKVKTPPKPPAPTIVDSITPEKVSVSLSEDESNLLGGPDQVKLLNRLITSIVQQALKPVYEEVSKRVDGIKTETKRAVAKSYEDRILEAHSDAEELFKSRRFIDWLKSKKVSEYTDETLYDVAVDANSSKDAATVIKIIAGYKTSINQKPAPTQQTKHMEAQTHFVPSVSSAPTAQPTNTQPFDGRKWVEAHKQYIKGDLAPEVFAKIDAEFNAQYEKGNVVNL